MVKWVLTFGVNIEELKEERGKEIPDLPYPKLCDWLEEQLRKEFPRYAIVPYCEDMYHSLRLEQKKRRAVNIQEVVRQILSDYFRKTSQSQQDVV